jgi:PPOX class probable F420-dependent enzyme
MPALSPEVQQFLQEPHLAVAVTLMPDGSPQATPVWVDHDGANAVINTVQGHQKERNLRRDARITLCVVDQGRPGRFLQLRGRAIDLDYSDAARNHIDTLSRKYSGRPYPLREGERRVKVTIEAEHVTYRGGAGAGRW